MPLLEIIAGEQTSDAALAKALDLAKQIKKTPIAVNDSPGFFTSRVIGTYINEALAMVGEGVDPQSIEQACTQAGYPVGALALSDELTLTLMRKIREANKDNTVLGGQGHPADAVVDKMIDELDRPSRAAGKGFYDYDDGQKARHLAGRPRGVRHRPRERRRHRGPARTAGADALHRVDRDHALLR